MSDALAPLRRHLERAAFAPDTAGPPLIGAEIELIPQDAQTRRVPRIEDGTGRGLAALLRAHGASRGWREDRTASGAPLFRLPDGAIVSFEPGGQIELSTPACRTAAELLSSAEQTIGALRASAAATGIALIARGVDPHNPLEDSPRQLDSERYRAMAAYFDRFGTAGQTMMRQTASVQIGVDFGAEWQERWRVANALAPYLIAIFANSATYADEPTGHRSWRAHLWRELDPARTGTFPEPGDPVEQYLRFALDAPWMFRRDDAGQPLPFGDWWARGAATTDDWERHVSTLFPEARPRGRYIEIRSLDAIEPEVLPAAIAIVAGLLYHAPTRRAAAELLSAHVAPHQLREAGKSGLQEPAVARVAKQLAELSLEGCRALGDYFSAADLERAAAFFDDYTLRGRCPADDGALVRA